jgi:hypothetical protein
MKDGEFLGQLNDCQSLSKKKKKERKKERKKESLCFMELHTGAGTFFLTYF